MADTLFVLPGFRLDEDANGTTYPANTDFSGAPLFSNFRIAAAMEIAPRTLMLTGSARQVAFKQQVFTSSAHVRVTDPDAFEVNTRGNIHQIVTVASCYERVVVISNLFHLFRFSVLAEKESLDTCRFLPAEAVLAAKHSWNEQAQRAIYGYGEVADTLIALTTASAGRLASGSDGWLTNSELAAFDALVAQLPNSPEKGPARELIPPEIKQKFLWPYQVRLLEELCGIADARNGTYAPIRTAARPAR